MNELGDATIRAHVRRRAGAPLAQANVERLTRSVVARLDERPRLLPRLFATAPVGARIGLTAALVIAVSLIAVPLAGGPNMSMQPSAGAATEGATSAATADAHRLQVLSLAELQRVMESGDRPPYRHHIVVADVDLQPDAWPPPCIPVPEGQSSPSIDPCWVEGHVVGAIPAIRVGLPTKDTDFPTTFLPEGGVNGPVIVRITGANTLQLVDAAPRVAGEVAWPLQSFIAAARNLPRTMELRRSPFAVGWPYVVDAQLVQGASFYCAIQTPPSDPRVAGFACGSTAWLAPSEVPDPQSIANGWSSRPADWVRLQNGAYFAFGGQPVDADATAPDQPVHGFYLVGPVLKFDPAMCFQCDAGAVAILYARLEPVPIP
jgi:hypothetical protein